MLLFFWRAVVAAITSTPGRVVGSDAAVWLVRAADAARHFVVGSTSPAISVTPTTAARNAIASTDALVYFVTCSDAAVA